MAEGMLRTLLIDNGARADIGSAGLLPGGAPATPHAVAVMAERGMDISRHVSRTIDPGVVRSTPLIIGMAREHVRDAIAGYGADVEHTFTLKGLVRLGERAGPRRPDETVFDWLARVAAVRRSADRTRDHRDDDIADPVGRSRVDYEATARELDALLRRLVALMIGGPPRDAADAADAAYAGSSPSRGAVGEAGYVTGGA
jgi:protein-tyrosine-phosphatase